MRAWSMFCRRNMLVVCGPQKNIFGELNFGVPPQDDVTQGYSTERLKTEMQFPHWGSEGRFSSFTDAPVVARVFGGLSPCQASIASWDLLFYQFIMQRFHTLCGTLDARRG
ncbi:uncharacterized protein PADG_01383 [Paracoccidioides brasiliensis Pb18]|uniref:Uncharacterized protein n=2 Tax=Paracoccidioides brasiliensis TaxID=121759 RepID=C1G367_PARBD|nr:uncharacterized protein PADG_01383 [Paracoccidioides brasiliensis Pb18]EEH45233.2 hypothetical protein PADG_01383 [Paracoccidioides brasiliensis Pb18]ODH35803.1 hypothetical protein ACO22_02868 [Paracoccidioides brasiliensis]ODH51296.1 hypothetical protein GX48_02536 [Paracoccidioides brasiliensis]